MNKYTVRFYYAQELTIEADSRDAALQQALDTKVDVDCSTGCINYCEALDPEVYLLEE
jgi:hypothetical protein